MKIVFEQTYWTSSQLFIAYFKQLCGYKNLNEKMVSSRYQRMLAIPEQEYLQSRNMEQTMNPLKTEMSSLTC